MHFRSSLRSIFVVHSNTVECLVILVSPVAPNPRSSRARNVRVRDEPSKLMIEEEESFAFLFFERRCSTEFRKKAWEENKACLAGWL